MRDKAALPGVSGQVSATRTGHSTSLLHTVPKGRVPWLQGNEDGVRVPRILFTVIS